MPKPSKEREYKVKVPYWALRIIKSVYLDNDDLQGAAASTVRAHEAIKKAMEL